ncbi:hypothetical protein BDV96DRAFT_509239 [Lophiotrema nucula]|uniref:Biogenesis of lysosome-related organelles complex 1 subunit 1 n=1 Tax=Lophiotrema nucula TaxID=690887 RepID=A0A6A5YGS1_9PLEO|nr:hypothetical protein BDV96DRAFT_509239 [Lophiotrema nucula]
MSSTDSESERRTAEARAAVTASLLSIGSSADAELRTRAADLNTNSQSIEKQEALLAKQSKALAKEEAKWQKLVDSGTKKLNEIGDIQNWAEMIERDLLVLEETVRLAENKGREEVEVESASGTGRWGL